MFKIIQKLALPTSLYSPVAPLSLLNLLNVDSILTTYS